MLHQKDHVAMEDAGGNVKFNPETHLTFAPPAKIWSMEDLGFSADVGVSPVAVSAPFPLFSEDAVNHMRDDIMRPDVQATCTFSSNIADRQLRGYAKRFAPFTHAAWTNAQTLEVISKVAGIDLVPVFDYEIGHINFSTKSDEQVKEELSRVTLEDEGIAGCQDDQNTKPVVGWHKDSYPFVAVLMMSDCTNMKGGETAIRTADGSIIKVKSPTKGCAVVLQGRYLAHQALRAFGAQERITAVTSFRPKSPFVRDDSVLRTVRPVSDLNLLYAEFAMVRLAMMQARVKQMQEEVEARYKAGADFNVGAVNTSLADLDALVQQTNGELVDPKQVAVGMIEEMHLANA